LKGIPFTKFIPGIIWFIVVLVLITLPGKDFPKVDDWYHRWYVDKWIHSGIFGVLAFLFMFPFAEALKDITLAHRHFRNIAFFTIVWGFLTECIQLLVPGRSFDLMDALADASGAIMVYVYFRKLQQKKTA
jgi:hypothetical protein